jgi:hypothetical protein
MAQVEKETNRLVLRIPGTSEKVELLLEKNKATTVGRDDKNVMVVPDSEASRFHCKIYYREDSGYVIEDLNSANGTFVNGERINEKILKNRDNIKIGSTEIVVFLEGLSGVNISVAVKSKKNRMLLLVIALLAVIFVSKLLFFHGSSPPSPGPNNGNGNVPMPPPVDNVPDRTAEELLKNAQNMKERFIMDIGRPSLALRYLEAALQRTEDEALRRRIEIEKEEVTEYIEKKYREQRFEYYQKRNIKDVEGARRALKDIIKLIPEGTDERHIWASGELRRMR